MIRICLFHTAEDFPDCTGNAQAIKVSIPAGEGATATVEGLSQGSYAVALLHEENANGKLDKSIGIPREGVGFSRNPSFFFGPPSFDAARFETDGTTTTEEIGRASCRERVCQYVYISVVAVSLKKNKIQNSRKKQK